jgi:hypothetical protein
LYRFDLLGHVLVARRRGTLPRMLDLIARLPNLSNLTLNLNIDKDSPIQSTLSAAWITVAPRLLGLHVHVDNVASCAALLSLDGCHLVHLQTLHITYDQMFRASSLPPYIPPKAAEDVAHHMAKLVGGVKRTLKSLRVDFEKIWFLRLALVVQELARHHFVALHSLHLTFPGIYGESPELAAFVRRHAHTLTSYHVLCKGLFDEHTPQADSLCALARDVQALTRMQTFSIHVPIGRPGPWGARMFDTLLTILDAMPDSVITLVLCTDGEAPFLGSTQLARLARLPATLSNSRGTALENLRSLNIGVRMDRSTLLVLPALENGLPLLEDLRLHVSCFMPESRHVLTTTVVRGCLAHVRIRSIG